LVREGCRGRKAREQGDWRRAAEFRYSASKPACFKGVKKKFGRFGNCEELGLAEELAVHSGEQRRRKGPGDRGEKPVGGGKTSKDTPSGPFKEA